MKIKLFGWEVGRNYPGRWYRYLIPKRITLKCNPPVYKWTWFFFAPRRAK